MLSMKCGEGESSSVSPKLLWLITLTYQKDLLEMLKVRKEMQNIIYS